MAKTKRKFVYEGGVRFEVTPHGLVCCLEGSKDKKHPCLDCKFCQWCSDSRCSLCLDQGRYHEKSTMNPGVDKRRDEPILTGNR